MIKFKRRPQEPSVLRSSKVSRKKREIERCVRKGIKVPSEHFRLDRHESGQIRGTLWEHQEYKCCYCERKRELKRESDVEHYRPKSGIIEEPGRPGYWWLAYEWTNCLYACKVCNEDYKKHHFPLLQNSPRARRPADNLAKEKPAILNPFDDNPEECIGFDWRDSNNCFVRATPEDIEGRGEKTIKLTGLNRPKLAEERGKLLLLLQGIAGKMDAGKHYGNECLIRDAAREIERETKSNQQFAGFRRAFFRKRGFSQCISNG